MRTALRQKLGDVPFRILGGAAVGAALAVFALLVGLIRMVFAVLTGARVGFEDLGLVVVYVAAFVAGGAVSGILWPVRRWIGGYYGLGIVAMLFVVGAISVHLAGPPAACDTGDWTIWAALSVIFGLAVGHGAESA